MFTHTVISEFCSLKSVELAALERAWNTIAERLETPLLGFDWFFSCANTLHAQDRLSIVVVSCNGTVVAIAPLYVDENHGYRRLRLLGTSSLYEPSGLLYSNEAALSYLLGVVFRLRMPVDLSRISDNSTLKHVSTDISWKYGLRFVRRTASSNYIRTCGSWSAFEQGLSANRRSDLRRKARKAKALGEVDIQVLAPTVEDVDQIFEKALLIEDKSWKGTAGSSLLKKPGLRRFFEQFSRRACAKRWLRVFFLTIDDTPVAMQIAVEASQALWILKLGYRQDFSKYSLGIALSHATIQYCFEQGLTRYEFLGSSESWQSTWPATEQKYCTIVVFPWSRLGIIGLASLVREQLWKVARRLLGDTEKVS